ncbi:MAG TPA: hypothetical protein VMT64_06820 [Candidatus Binataceae bacterium]|nr:hypothetical protein [Candidatus Binataceae bacterium]
MPDKSNVWSIAITAIASVLIGFAISTLAYRMRILRVPAGSFVGRLDNKVHLTSTQREQVTEIIDKTRDQIEGLRHDYFRARRAAMWDSYDKVRAVLTPEQQQIFDRDFAPPWGTRKEAERSPASASPSPAGH